MMRSRWLLVIGGVVVLAGVIGGIRVLRPASPLANAVRLMDAGDMRGAELYLRDAIEKTPEDAEVLYRLGIVDLALSNPVAAERELKHARDRGYDPLQIVPLLGQAYLQQRRYDDALQEFSLARAPKGAEADVLAIRAQAFLAQRDIDSAAQSVADALKRKPDEPQILLTAARVAIARNDVDAAERDAQTLLKNDPNSLDAQLVMSDVYLRRGNAQKSLEAAQKVLAAGPRRLDARLATAKAFLALDRLNDASEALDVVLQGSPRDVAANFLKVVLSVRQRDFRAADQALNLISPVLGELPRGFYFLAVAKLGVGQPAQAAEAAAKLLAQEPNDQQAIKLSAFVDLASGRPDPALALLRATAANGNADADMYDMIGRAEAMKGNKQGAIDNLTRAVTLDPKNTEMLNRLAAAKLQAGDIAAAESTWRQSLQLAPDQAVATESLVNAALARGDAVAARAAIDKLRATVGDTVAVGLLEGNVKLAAFDFPGARQDFAELLKRYPDNRTVKLSLVRAQTMLGNPEGGMQILRDMLAEHADDEEALGIILPVLFAQKRNDEAVKLAEAARAAAPLRPSMIAALAGAYVRSGTPERAVDLLERSGAATNPQLGFLKANALIAANRRDDARDALRKVLEQAPGDMRAVQMQLVLLVQARDFDSARAMVTESLRANPGDPFLLGAKVGIEVRERGVKAGLDEANQLMMNPVNLPAARELPGDAWQSIGDQSRAADAYLAQFHEQPTPGLMNKAVQSLSAAGRVDEAAKFLNDWLPAHPNDADAQMVLSSLLITQKKYADAEATLNKVLTLRPNDATALNNLAWLVAERGDLARGRAIAQRAYFLSPSIEIADTLGWIAARQGDLTDAMPLLRMAAESSTSPSVIFHFAKALHASGSNDEARSTLKKLLDQFKTFDDRAAAESLLAEIGQ